MKSTLKPFNWLSKIVLMTLLLSLGLTASAPAVHADDVQARKLGSPVEVHVDDKGKIIVQGARVDQIAGSVLYTKIYWGLAFLRVMVRTDANTKVIKKFGQTISMSDISVGDYISVTGEFFSGSDTFAVLAKEIRDWSVQTENDEFKGTVSQVQNSSQFLMTDDKGKTITVAIATSTVIIKGTLFATTDDIKGGDRVLSATGTFNHFTNTLSATSIKIYKDLNVYKSRNFEGRVKSVNYSGQLPATMKIVVTGKEYDVMLNTKTQVLNNKRAAVRLSRYITEDKVRVYGAIREAEPNVIDAEIVRNLDL